MPGLGAIPRSAPNAEPRRSELQPRNPAIAGGARFGAGAPGRKPGGAPLGFSDYWVWDSILDSCTPLLPPTPTRMSQPM
jgi:hypothetical protein